MSRGIATVRQPGLGVWTLGRLTGQPHGMISKQVRKFAGVQ